MSWFTIGSVQYASHTLVHLSWENHYDVQDKSSLQLGGSLVWSQMDNPNPWTNYGLLITLYWTYDLDLFMQLLMHLSHVQCKWCGVCMLK